MIPQFIWWLIGVVIVIVIIILLLRLIFGILAIDGTGLANYANLIHLQSMLLPK